MRAVIVGFAMFTALAVTAACSSIPEVRFSDELDGGGTDGGDAGPICPSATPPDGGICCGSRACIGCTIFQCDDCGREGCNSTQVCCRRGVSMQCRSLASCQ